MPWYAVRTIYHFGAKSNGKNLFEERVVCFEASDWPEPIQKQKKNPPLTPQKITSSPSPEHSGYEQDGKALIDRYELWSELFESTKTLEEFYANRYGKYEYHPE